MSKTSAVLAKRNNPTSQPKTFSDKSLKMDSRRQFSSEFGKESASVLQWKESLRLSKDMGKSVSLSGSPSRRLSLPAPSSFTFRQRRSPLDDGRENSLQRSGSAGNLRKSTGSLAANFSTNTMSSTKSPKSGVDLDRIEAEYIKNLQQQVYFLELEANYLREQSKKATEMHPHMTAEAQRMLTKLRQMQASVDGFQMESKRKDASLELAKAEQERILSRLKAEEESFQREKRLLLDEVVQLKKENEVLQRDGARKETQLLTARQELDKNATAMRNHETKMQLLRNQLEQKGDEVETIQRALDEKRAELLKVESMLHDVEDKYYSSTAQIQDSATQDLRDEVRILRQKVKEAEMSADQDRYLRSKLADDSSHLVRDNAVLSQQVAELGKQLEREKALRENKDDRRSKDITELVKLREQEKTLKFEANQAKEQLQREKEHTQRLMQQLASVEQRSSSLELSTNTTQSRLVEMEGISEAQGSENSQLRRDKILLVDHVADLQKQIEDCDAEAVLLRTRVHELESRLKELGHLKELEASLHSQKWEEFSRLADSMKHLSKTMVRSSSPHLPASSQVIDSY